MKKKKKRKETTISMKSSLLKTKQKRNPMCLPKLERVF
tara:strand:+ start:402 stop:515 length:114 start_codon:yes stop_codon:yes gene_type:complete